MHFNLLKSNLSSVLTFEMARTATLAAAWRLISRYHYLHISRQVFTAPPLAWTAIAADDTKTLDAIAILGLLGPYFITVFVL